jgi:arylsulfatase A-like enzyme
MRWDKTMTLDRRAKLAEIMMDGRGYAVEYSWYHAMFGKSEKTFQSDRTIIHKQWKVTHNVDMEARRIELLQRIESDRQLARSLGDAGSALNADKLHAQIDGFLNKQGETAVTVQVLNVQGYTDEQLIQFKKIISS